MRAPFWPLPPDVHLKHLVAVALESAHHTANTLSADAHLK